MDSKPEATEIQQEKFQGSTSTKPSSPAVMGHIEELHTQAELAHRDYLQAQRKVVSAYREKEQRDVEVYKEIGFEAQKACDTALEKALNKLKEREQKATEAYQKEREEAVNI